jgi:hypothetical protein
MFMATFLFLGIAGLIVAVSACLAIGKRAGRYVEVDLDALSAASICLSAGRRKVADSTTATGNSEPTQDEKSRWREMKMVWMEWYGRCQEKSLLKQKTMYSWARTLALCAVLCVVGVLLEATFGQSISLSHILDGFRSSHPAATSSQRSPSAQHSS